MAMARWRTISSKPHTHSYSRIAAFAVPSAIALVIAAITAPTWIKNLATDDALYYPTVARNIASGLGSTFDGITTTNGYHPLWCWLQVPIAMATSSFGPMTYLWFVKVLIVLAVVLTIVVWDRLVFRVTGSHWMSVTFVVLLGAYWWSVHVFYGGMETPLVVLLMGVCLLLAHSLLRDSAIHTAAALGVAMAATFLARLDSVFFVGILSCFLLLALRRNLRTLLAWLVPMVLLPLPYLWWNLAYFGSLMPVSGQRKSVFPPDLEKQAAIIYNFVTQKTAKLVAVLHPAGAVLALLIVIAFIGVAWLMRRDLVKQAKQFRILWIVPAAAILHFAYVAVFMVEIDVSWYQYAEYLTAFLGIAFVVSVATGWLRSRGGRLAAVQWAPFAAVYVVVVIVLATFAPKAMPDLTNVRSFEAADWAKQHLAAGNPRFGMYDPGVFSFVSGFNTIALNGLASTPQVTTLVRESNWTEIIRRYHIKYIVQFVAEKDIDAIGPQFIKFRSEPFEKYLWRYDQKKWGRYLILDTSYPETNSLI